MGYSTHSQILTDSLEDKLQEYILHSSKIYYGLNSKDVRSLAYELGVANDIQIPNTWKNSKAASKEWFSRYMKRHPTLSLRSPEATSLSRATSFNKTNVKAFLRNLKTVMENGYIFVQF